ncbi:MAG: hypothetical protein KDC38_12135, partial [Planctomycetes bacterium]|nr:hypothetical protein [Planctomycetota bacterium]
MRCSMVAFCLLLALLGAVAHADVTISHDNNVVALPPPPGNAIFNQPDIGDLFANGAFVRTAPGTNLGNLLLADSQSLLGLLPGDDINAVHIELRPLANGDEFGIFPAFTFSVDVGAAGGTGTAVAAQAPFNAADLFESNGSGFNAWTLDELQMGLAATAATDIDANLLTQLSSLTGNPWVYFSLAPGSPTLSALGASAADILATRALGTPKVSITATQLGLRNADDLDALVMLSGADANDDGDFNDPGDSFPMVIFSVSPSSQGRTGTAVNGQFINDFPPGGDIFFSSLGGVNTLFRDDAVLGLANDDNLDSLDLPEMSVPGVPPLTG